MSVQLKRLPSVVILLICAAFLLHGVIPQYAHYHEFADRTRFAGISNAFDVLSNLPFALVGIVGLYWLGRSRLHATRDTLNSLQISASSLARLIFAMSVCATSIGSTYYHLSPDDARLFWDRLPIAFACASLLAEVHIDAWAASAAVRIRARYLHLLAMGELLMLMIFALLSVVWWQRTGDLRWYLALQALAIVLIPLWQWIHVCQSRQRILFGLAIAGYGFAKLAELNDAAILTLTGLVSGHSLKHLLAASAAGLILFAWRRVPSRETC